MKHLKYVLSSINSLILKKKKKKGAQKYKLTRFLCLETDGYKPTSSGFLNLEVN